MAFRGKEPFVATVVAQPVVGTLTRSAIFLVLKVNPGGSAEEAVRSLCGDLAGLLRAVGFRDLDGRLTCVMGFGSDVWDRLFAGPRPAELRTFKEINRVHR